MSWAAVRTLKVRMEMTVTGFIFKEIYIIETQIGKGC